MQPEFRHYPIGWRAQLVGQLDRLSVTYLLCPNSAQQVLTDPTESYRTSRPLMISVCECNKICNLKVAVLAPKVGASANSATLAHFDSTVYG